MCTRSTGASSDWRELGLGKPPNGRPPTSLDAYQLVKHYLGLARSYRGCPLLLVYIYREPANARVLPLFDEHRAEVERFGRLVAGDRGCRFEALSYGEHWRGLDALKAKPAWLDRHLLQLRLRYEVEI